MSFIWLRKEADHFICLESGKKYHAIPVSKVYSIQAPIIDIEIRQEIKRHLHKPEGPLYQDDHKPFNAICYWEQPYHKLQKANMNTITEYQLMEIVE